MRTCRMHASRVSPKADFYNGQLPVEVLSTERHGPWLNPSHPFMASGVYRSRWHKEGMWVGQGHMGSSMIDNFLTSPCFCPAFSYWFSQTT